MTATLTTTQVQRVYIKASAEKIWQALTDPEWTNRYGYTGFARFDLKPGGSFLVEANEEFKAQASQGGYVCPDVVIDGEVVEVDEPHKLVFKWRMLMDPGMEAEGFTQITYEIKDIGDGACSLTLVHELEGAPKTAAMVGGEQEDVGAGGGWAWVLSDLKSLLETGSTLSGKS